MTRKLTSLPPLRPCFAPLSAPEKTAEAAWFLSDELPKENMA